MRFLGLTILAFLSLGSLAWSAPAGGEPSAVGVWEQSDEKTGRAESWFNIVEKDGVYIGTIVKMFQQSGEPAAESWRCTKCEGAEKNAQVLGLALIKGMKRKGLRYEGGTIMDPRDGTVYRAVMQLSPDGAQLEVRGFLGIEMLGRSQMWKRLPDNAMDPAPTPRRPTPPAKK